MQQVKYFVRGIGDPRLDPTGAYRIVSPEDAENDLGFNYLSKGWVIESSFFSNVIRDDKGNEIGYRIGHILVKESEVAVKDKTKEK